MRQPPFFWLGAEADPPKISARRIQEVVAGYYKVPLMELSARRGGMATVQPRQLAMYLVRQLTTQSFPEIGRRFGNRDHTTVMHAVKQVKVRLKSNAVLMEDAAQIHRALFA